MPQQTPSQPKHPLALRLLRPAFRTLQAVSTDGAAAVAERVFFRAPRSRYVHRSRPLLATGQRFELQVDGRRVVGWSWGTGEPVYLVHGWGSSAGRWHPLSQPLIEAGHKVVLFDAPGHGQSGRGMSSMPEFARALTAVTGLIGPAHGIVAHSLGAAATTLALARGVTARRVVLIAPPANPADWAQGFAEALGLDEAVIQLVRTRSQRRLRFDWNDLDIVAHARGMTVPALVVHDRGDDVVSPRDGAAIAEAWPGARLVETEGLGHRALVRDPAVIREVVGFVGGQGG